MNQDIYNIYENYKQIYVLEEGSMLDKIKAAIAAAVILTGSLQADDNRARMAKDKINKMSPQEITQTFPSTVKAVQQTDLEQNNANTKIDSTASLFNVFVSAWGQAFSSNPEIRDKLTNSVSSDIDQNKNAENVRALLDVVNNIQKQSIPQDKK